MIALILLALICVVLYLFSIKNHNYWKQRNVKHDPPTPLFGNHLRNQLGKLPWVQIFGEFYNKYPEEKVVGYYIGNTPTLVVKDLDLVRQILSVDFASFFERGLGRNHEKEWLLANVFHAEGDMWRLLRQRLTPAFTTAKLRAMFPLVVKCAERLQAACGAGGEQDAREIMARFTTDFIGACGFGIEMGAIDDEHSHFRELGRKIFRRSIKDRILIPLTEIFPILNDKFSVADEDVQDSVVEIVENIRKQRNYKPCGRNDWIDLLLELEEKGTIKGESIEKHNTDGSPVEVELKMDLKIFAAQVFVFFAAGFETSSSATSFTLHELAYNPDVQARVQESIDEVMLKYDNKLCYDAIAEMSLLDMTFKEGMRMFPSLGILNRTCRRRYTIPGTDVTLDPGVKIIVPVQSIHMDEKYYEDPKEFRPERFTPEEVQRRHKYAYLPFGEGPRACIGWKRLPTPEEVQKRHTYAYLPFGVGPCAFIGAKLGHMQSLVGLAAILHKFTVEPAPSSKRELSLNPYMNIVQGLNGGLPIILKLRKKNQ